MSERKNQLGIVGLGKMGGNLALQAMEKGMEVVGLTLGGASEELKAGGLVEVRSASEFKARLRRNEARLAC